LVATKAIKEGEMLLKVPMQWVMHSEHARRHPTLKHVLMKGSKAIPRGMGGEKFLVALLLMVEACKEGRRSAACRLRRETSEWKPYIDVLPKNFSSAPMFWAPAELGELRGSQILDMHEEDEREVNSDYNGLLQIMNVDKDTFCDECFSKQKFKWASWVVHSRALTLQGIKFLIPLADMVNYEPENRDAQRRDHQELFLKYHKVDKALTTGYAETRADRDFAVGEGIVESYGDNANHMYLRFFGFVPKENPTDCATLKFRMGEKEPEGRMKILQEQKIAPTVEACIRKGQDPPLKMMGFLRVAQMKEDEYGQAHVIKRGQIVSNWNERAVAKAVMAQAQARLDGFPNPAAEDKKLLEGGGLSPSVEAAVRARLSEKRILRDIVRRMKARIERFKGGVGEL